MESIGMASRVELLEEGREREKERERERERVPLSSRSPRMAVASGERPAYGQ